MNKLVYHDGSVGVVYFPPGKLSKGGSCEFATKKCLRECGLKINQVEVETYNFFIEKSVGEIVEQILKELFYFSRKMVRWFAAGDCPRKLENKIVQIMKCLSEQDVIQNGFTRNEYLWRKIKEISGSRFVLTVEKAKIAEKLSVEGFVAVPDYPTGRVKIFSQEDKIYDTIGTNYMCGGGFITCGSSFVDTEEEDEWGTETVISEEDCGICYDRKVGCFANRRTREKVVAGGMR